MFSHNRIPWSDKYTFSHIHTHPLTHSLLLIAYIQIQSSFIVRPIYYCHESSSESLPTPSHPHTLTPSHPHHHPPTHPHSQLLRTEPDLIPSCAETVWPLVLEGREKHKSFMRSLKALLSLVYHPLLLLLPRQHNPTTEAITDMQEKVLQLTPLVMKSIYFSPSPPLPSPPLPSPPLPSPPLSQFARRYHKAGEARVGIYNLLVEHVCGVWWSAIGDGCLETVLSSLTANSELLLLACVFGPVHKKNLRWLLRNRH